MADETIDDLYNEITDVNEKPIDVPDELSDEILTRNRMLELSQEKNVFRTKVIYTIRSIIIAILIFIILYKYY